MLGEMSKSKAFLNLFSYTGSASITLRSLEAARAAPQRWILVHYLEWANADASVNPDWAAHADSGRLLGAGQMRNSSVRLYRSPTFSNSKRMEESF